MFIPKKDSKIVRSHNWRLLKHGKIISGFVFLLIIGTVALVSGINRNNKVQAWTAGADGGYTSGSSETDKICFDQPNTACTRFGWGWEERTVTDAESMLLGGSYWKTAGDFTNISKCSDIGASTVIVFVVYDSGTNNKGNGTGTKPHLYGWMDNIRDSTRVGHDNAWAKAIFDKLDYDGKGDWIDPSTGERLAWFCNTGGERPTCPIGTTYAGQPYGPSETIKTLEDCNSGGTPPPPTVDTPINTLRYACYSHGGAVRTDQKDELLYESTTPPSAAPGCTSKEVTSQSYGIPTTQFLGGQGVLTATDINTTIFKTNSSGDRIFGTWTEYAIVSGGKVNGMGSGAALGYNGGFLNTNAFNSASKDGGGNKRGGGLVTANLSNRNNSYKCAYSKMTIYNQDCDSSSVGNATDNILNGKLQKSQAQRKKLEDWFMPTKSTSAVASGGSVISKRNTYSKDQSDAYCTVNSITIQNLPPLGESDFHVYCARNSSGNAKVTIGGDIIIDGTFNADTVPQVLIFADIVEIRSNVKRIDAWIIATKKVTTCVVPTGGVSCATNQLVINGPVFAETLTLNRTYTNLNSKEFDGRVAHNGKQTFEVTSKDGSKGCEDNTKTDINTYRVIQGKNDTENWGYKVISKTYDWTGYKEERYEYIKENAISSARPYANTDTNYGYIPCSNSDSDCDEGYKKDNRTKYETVYVLDKNGNKTKDESGHYITKCQELKSYYDGYRGGDLYDSNTKKCVKDNKTIYLRSTWKIVTNYTDSPDDVYDTGSVSNYKELANAEKTATYPIEVCFIAEPAEVFNLRADARIWAYSETKKRLGSASVTGLTEVLPFW